MDIGKLILICYNTYVDTMLLFFEEGGCNKLNNDEKKMKILKLVNEHMVIHTSGVAEILNMDKLEAFNILRDMLFRDKVIGSAGNPNPNDMDANTWKKR